MGWISLATGAVLLSCYNLYCLRRLRVSRIDIPIYDLPEQHEGLRIAHLSDLHLGQLGTFNSTIMESFDVTKRFEPDLILLTGDYVDATPFSAHSAPLTFFNRNPPVVAVLGNHDYEHGPAHVARTLSTLETAGVTVLCNEAVEISLCNSSLRIVGLDDPFTLRSDIAWATRNVCTDRVPTLLLAHAPVLDAFGNLERFDIILCGHTHGGQIRILPSGSVPGKRVLRWLLREKGPRRDPALFRGIHRFGRATVVISEGLGVSLLPLRFRTRPHLVLITLHQA